MFNAVDDFSLISFKGRAFNLIPSRFPPIDLYEDIANESKWPALMNVERFTNPRLIEQQRRKRLGIYLSEEEAQNWNFAPFSYPNPDGTFFFGPPWRTLELAKTKLGALAASIEKREGFLFNSAFPRTRIDVRMIERPVEGQFVDANNYVGLPDEKRRQFGNIIATKIMDGSDYTGVVFRKGHKSEEYLSFLANNVTLGRAIQCEHYSYAWDGNQITNVYCYDEGGNSYSREEIMGAIQNQKSIGL